MDTQPIWDSLSGITIGQIVAWITVILAIISALCTATIKLYKVFTKYKEMKDKEEKQETIIENHDKTLNEIKDSLQEIKQSLIEQKEVNLKQTRHTIVHTCEVFRICRCIPRQRVCKNISRTDESLKNRG